MEQLKKKCKKILPLFLVLIMIVQELPMLANADDVMWDVPKKNATVGIEFDMLDGVMITTEENQEAMIEISNVTSVDENYTWNGVDTTFTPKETGQYNVSYNAVAITEGAVLGCYTREIQVDAAESPGGEALVETDEDGKEKTDSQKADEDEKTDSQTIEGEEKPAEQITDEKIAETNETDKKPTETNEETVGIEKNIDGEKGSRAGGDDRTNDFKIDKFILKIAGNVVYSYDGVTETINSQTIETTYNPKFEFELEYSQVNPAQADFQEGDYILFEVCEVMGDDANSGAIDWSGLTAPKPLYFGDVQFGVGELVPVKIDEYTIVLYLKITFTNNIAGQSDISGVVSGGASVSGLVNEGDEIIVNVDDESVSTIDKVDPTPSIGPPGEINGTTISAPHKNAISYNDSLNTILWRIYATEYASIPFQDYKNGTSTTYSDLIVEDILDINQTFKSISIRAPLYLYEEENPANNVKYNFTTGSFSFQFSAGTSKLTDYSSDTDAEAKVRATPLSYAIITEPDVTSPVYTIQRLILNLGSPGVNGLLFSDLNLNMDTVVDALLEAYDNSEAVLTVNPTAAPEDVLTDINDKSATQANWEKFNKLYDDSKIYYNRFVSIANGGGGENPYVYSYEIDITTDIKTDQDETNLSTLATNSFRLSGGLTTVGGYATRDNFWSGIIRATAMPGDAQIFKADSLYGNIAGDKANAAGIPGAIEGVQFEVYLSDGTGPLAFDYVDGKYVYSDNEGGSSVTTVVSKVDGSFIISGLEPGDYYIKEIGAPEGYYTGQNEKIEFSINSTLITYNLINNDPRGVSLVKVDAEDSDKVLENATFELYKYANADFSDAIKLSGFTNKTINGIEYLVYDNSGIDTLTTGSDGKLNIVQLAAGKYYLQEISAPSGYRVSDEKHLFELSAQKTGDTILALGTIENESSDQIEFIGTKNLTGKILEDNMFHFVIEDENGNIVATATNKADGTIHFGSIKFQKGGTYTYKIREINDKAEGISYDDMIYAIAVTVVQNSDGTLNATVEYPSTGIVFQNEFDVGEDGDTDIQNAEITPDGAKFILKGTKKLIGKTLEDNMFSFIATDENGETVETGYNKADGSIEFEIELTEPGTYTYTVAEVHDGKDGFTYDDTEYTIIVVAKVEDSDTMKAEISYPDGRAVFNNSYIKTDDNKADGSNDSKKDASGKTTDPGKSVYSRLVKTGDSNMVSYWLIALGISASLIGILFWVRYKKKQRN